MSNDQEVIRQRVLQDDRKLRNLYRSFLALAPSSTSNDSTASSAAALDAAQAVFSLEANSLGLTLAKGKQAILDDSLNREVLNYRSEIRRINDAQVSTKAEIERLREDLVQAQRIRQNLMEYDRLAKEINKVSSRESFYESIERLQHDIRDLESQETRYTETWALRKAVFDEIVSSIEQMGERVREEQNEQERRRALDDDAQEGDGAAQVDAGEADTSTTAAATTATPTGPALDPSAPVFKPSSLAAVELPTDGGDAVMEDGEV